MREDLNVNDIPTSATKIKKQNATGIKKQNAAEIIKKKLEELNKEKNFQDSDVYNLRREFNNNHINQITDDDMTQIRERIKDEFIRAIVDMCKNGQVPSKQIEKELGTYSVFNISVSPNEVIEQVIKAKQDTELNCFDKATCGIFSCDAHYKYRVKACNHFKAVINILNQKKKQNGENYNICNLETLQALKGALGLK